MRILLSVALVALVAPSALSAQQRPSVEVDDVECFPRDDNGRVTATVRNTPPGGTVRLYFRWNEARLEAFYYVDMVTNDGSKYWVLPPQPEDRNNRIEYYVSILDAAGDEVLREPAETDVVLSAPVTRDCELDPPLTDREDGFRTALTVGETVEEQEDDEVMGFKCPGVIRRINYLGVPRADARCNPCAVAWWIPLASAAPAAALGSTIDPVSPTRPARN
jgi:hypothetical protein